MDALDASLNKIRARSGPPVELKSAGEYQAEVLREFGYPEDADAAEERRRLQFAYAAFPPDIKAAMKTAATRNAWCRATWAMQTALIQDALLSGRVLESELVAGYSLKPPEMALEAT